VSLPLFRLEELVNITKGKKQNLSDAKTPTRYIQIDDLRNDDLIKYTADDVGTFVGEGDVIIAWDGANAGTVGYGLNGLIGSTLARLTIINIEVNAEYLARFLQSKFKEIRGNCTGATIPHVSKPHLLSLEIPLPPLDEQKRIAAILDKADSLRRKRKEAIDLADEFLGAVFLDMFGDSAGQGWELVTVEDLAAPVRGSMRTGPFGSDLKHAEFVEKGISVLGIDNAVKNKFDWGKDRFISHEKYEQLKRYTVKPGDVIITIMGTCGRCAVVPEDIPIAINTKHLCCITLDQSKCLPSFMHAYFLKHPVARKYLSQTAKGAVMDGLNMGIIKSLPIPLVPMDLQKKYESICKQLSKLDKNNLEAESYLNDCFSSLSQKAFKGELSQKNVA
jgi:type I restriction enzyme S subunit